MWHLTRAPWHSPGRPTSVLVLTASQSILLSGQVEVSWPRWGSKGWGLRWAEEGRGHSAMRRTAPDLAPVSSLSGVGGLA